MTPCNKLSIAPHPYAGAALFKLGSVEEKGDEAQSIVAQRGILVVLKENITFKFVIRDQPFFENCFEKLITDIDLVEPHFVTNVRKSVVHFSSKSIQTICSNFSVFDVFLWKILSRNKISGLTDLGIRPLDFSPPFWTEVPNSSKVMKLQSVDFCCIV